MTLTLLVFGVVVWAIFDAIAHTNEVGWIGDGVSALPFVFSSWRMIGTPTGQQALGAVALLLCPAFGWLVLVSVLQQLGASEYPDRFPPSGGDPLKPDRATSDESRIGRAVASRALALDNSLFVPCYPSITTTDW